MKNMTDKKQLIKEFILNNPNLSGNEIYTEIKNRGLGIRKTDFYSLLRETRNLPEPSYQKRLKSVPKKYKIKIKIIPKKIPYEQTKFGKMAKDIEKKHNISERDAIEHTRMLLKIPKRDYRKLNRKDKDILTQYGY